MFTQKNLEQKKILAAEIKSQQPKKLAATEASSDIKDLFTEDTFELRLPIGLKKRKQMAEENHGAAENTAEEGLEGQPHNKQRVEGEPNHFDEIEFEDISYRFVYTLLSRTDKSFYDFINKPEALSLLMRWEDSQTPGQYKGSDRQAYYQTPQMKKKLGLIIKLAKGEQLDQKSVEIHKKYPFMSIEELQKYQNDATYRNFYAGKAQKNLQALLLKEVEIYHRSKFESPDLSTKLMITHFIKFCKENNLTQEIVTHGQLDINKMLIYLAQKDFQILRTDLDRLGLTHILKKEYVSKDIIKKLTPDERGYVNYGCLPPLIRHQMQQALLKLKNELGNDHFTLDIVNDALKKKIHLRNLRVTQEITKNKFCVPTYRYANSVEDRKTNGLIFNTSYSQPSPEEFKILTQEATLTKQQEATLTNEEKATLLAQLKATLEQEKNSFRLETLGHHAAQTKQPVPGFSTEMPGYIAAVDEQGALLGSDHLELEGQFAAEEQKNVFYPKDHERNYVYFQSAPDPYAMLENKKQSDISLERLNFYVRRTLDGLGGSFSMERDRLTFVIPINGDENKQQLAELEQCVRDAFGLNDNYYLRAGFPKINEKRKIAGDGDDKLTQPYYSFDFTIPPAYFLDKIFLPHREALNKSEKIIAPEEGKPENHRAEIHGMISDEKNVSTSPTAVELFDFQFNLKTLATHPKHKWAAILAHCKKYPAEAYTTIVNIYEGQLFETPLHWICYHAQKGALTKKDLLAFLRLPGVSQHINIENGHGYTAFAELINKNGSPELLQLGIDFGADINGVTTEPYRNVADQKSVPAHEARQHTLMDLAIHAVQKVNQEINDLNRKLRVNSNFESNQNYGELKKQLEEKNKELKDTLWNVQILQASGARATGYNPYRKIVVLPENALPCQENGAVVFSKRLQSINGVLKPAVVANWEELGYSQSKVLSDKEEKDLPFKFSNQEQRLNENTHLKKIAELCGCRQEIPIEPLRKSHGKAVTTYGDTPHPCQFAPSEAWKALLGQRCASAILTDPTDEKCTVLHVHIATIKNAIILAKKNAVNVMEIVLPDTFPNQGIKGTTLLQLACRKGLVELADTLISTLMEGLQIAGRARLFGYIENAFKELNALKTENPQAAASILASLLENYPHYLNLFSPQFKQSLLELSMACKKHLPKRLYDACHAAARSAPAIDLTIANSDADVPSHSSSSSSPSSYLAPNSSSMASQSAPRASVYTTGVTTFPSSLNTRPNPPLPDQRNFARNPAATEPPRSSSWFRFGGN